LIDQVVRRLRDAGCVFAEDEARLLARDAADAGQLAVLVRRRCAGTPLEHILGWAEFCGRRIAVEPGVFVPRRRTAFLVEQAAELAPDAAVIVDLCCGSGAVARLLAERVPRAEVHAADCDEAAVRCAQRNLTPVGGTAHRGDLFEALPERLRGGIDLLVANAPYVPTGKIALMPREARDFEPAAALDGGPDGVAVQRRIADGAEPWLAPGGTVVVETSRQQQRLSTAAFRRRGFHVRLVTSHGLAATALVASPQMDRHAR
jgi:release factor glutamine methyltransferase